MRGLELFVALAAWFGTVQAVGQPAWTVPRLANGKPDLEGTWENNSATPLERPPQLAGKPLLSEDELDALKARAAQLFGAEADAVFGDSLYLSLLDEKGPRLAFATGTYSQNWVPTRYFERRTSLIEDPADGRLPPLTPQAVQSRAARAAARPARARGAADFTLSDRCITFGVPDLFAAYMSTYRIIQTPADVVIQMEKLHDVRVIPLDGRPHVSPAIRQYLGDPRGHWDGDTLVVETTNFDASGNTMGGYFRYADENLRLTERFTRVSDDTLRYEFTVDDPTVWTRPWTAAIYWKKSSGEIYEYACHEGNYSMRGMLSALRAEESASEKRTPERAPR
ncbi:MAG TPA: hypothetical protein VFX89_00665 [Gammaproteobacteria bacterium]|nr:hypothetical protein [Gammaproteobacteria bacterium]